MAKSKPVMTTEAVVETLSAISPREGLSLELFKIADPAETMAIPYVLARCGDLLDGAARDLRAKGEPAAAKARERDALIARAIGDWILSIDDKAVRFRVQDLPDEGFARLSELMGQLCPRATSPAPIVKCLDTLKAGVLAAVTALAPAGDDDDR